MLLYCRDSFFILRLPSLDLGDCKPEVYGSYQTIKQMGAGKSVTNSTDRLTG